MQTDIKTGVLPEPANGLTNSWGRAKNTKNRGR